MQYRRTVSVIIGVGVLSGIVWYGTRNAPSSESPSQLASTTETSMIDTDTTEQSREAVIATWYAPLIPLMLGSESLLASVADTDAERQQGLSDTPYLPEGIVKLFIFETDNQWGFWMKDMAYPIDMVWLDSNKVVVHIAQNVTPDSYPTSFAPPVPARYVIETTAGFTATKGIVVGTVGAWEQ
jgi:uncharacterized membrane protein (UPF0127 family)